LLYSISFLFWIESKLFSFFCPTLGHSTLSHIVVLMQEGFLKENTEWALADLLIVQVALVF